MSRAVCEHGNWLESPCYYCQTKPPFSPVIAAKDARIVELEAAIARDMGGDYLSLQALYVRQIATLAQRDREIVGLRDALHFYADLEAWNQGRKTGFTVYHIARAALASTAQAADEAERRIRAEGYQDGRRHVCSLLSMLVYNSDRIALDVDGLLEFCDRTESAILGTESGEAQPTPEPHREPGWGHALGCPFNGLDVLECSCGMPNAPVSGEAQP